jgi:hypothetical protein
MCRSGSLGADLYKGNAPQEWRDTGSQGCWEFHKRAMFLKALISPHRMQRCIPVNRTKICCVFILQIYAEVSQRKKSLQKYFLLMRLKKFKTLATEQIHKRIAL